MAPQFVDFNADGHIDIVTATFDGSPWVSFGSKEGFQQPAHILDKAGKRIMLAQFWNYESKKWDNADHTAGAGANAHCISAYAFDWDGDGDLDLILGGRTGHLWLQVNEGTSKEPKFAGLSKQIMIGDKPLDAGGKVTSPRMVDWDGDGLPDLVVGTFTGNANTARGMNLGAVVWFRNVGKKGAPAFEAARTIIGGGQRSALPVEPAGPDEGLYFDVGDVNGDGLVDIVVGAYSHSAGEKTESGTVRNSRKPYIWVYHQQRPAKPDESAER